MNRPYTIILCALALLLGACGPRSSSEAWQRECYERVSLSIDSIDYFTAMNNKMLTDYRESLKKAESDDETFMYCLKIANLYANNNTKEALRYEQRAYDIAVRMGDNGKKTEALLTKSTICNVAGYLTQTRDVLDALKRMPMKQADRLEYYDNEVRYWNNYAIFYNLPQPFKGCVVYSDSILRSGVKLSPAMRLHAMFWHETNMAKKHQLLKEMNALAEKMAPDDPDYKRLCFETAVLADLLGNKRVSIPMATKSITVSFKTNDSYIIMLWYIIRDAVRAGELDYANKFLNTLTDYNDRFPDHLRVPIYGLQSQLHQKLLERERYYAQMSLALAIAASLLLLIGIINMVAIRRLIVKRKVTYKELKQQYAVVKEVSEQLEQEQQQLKATNDALRQQEAQLKESEQRLSEANYVKEEYIGQMFALCAEYLHKIEEVKKDLNRKLSAGQYDKALEATKINTGDDQKELRALWDKFDEVFLKLFPDFPEQFNRQLQPDKQIRLRDPKHLNTDLRIYALVRLGINNSVRISQILGLSTQTVYNARQKMRGRMLPGSEL